MQLFEPKSIAVIGASADEGSVGHDIFKNLRTQGYQGEVFPINPKRDEILGEKAYPSVKDVSVDLAIIVVPAKIVPIVLQECGDAGVQDIVIISAGFSEMHTKDGDALEQQVKDLATQYNLNVVGPNCLGIVRPSAKLNASFAVELPPKGGVALVSQSGATAVAVMDASESLGIGYSLVASIGNKAVLDESDFLEMAAADDETKVIGLYLENIKDGVRFLQSAMKVTPTKPVVLLKSGVSTKGSEAASSHTGALAGSDAGIEALCKQSGIIRAKNSQEFLDLLEGLSTQPKLATPNVAIVTNAGGPGILGTDAAELAGLILPKLEEKLETKLRKHLPDASSTSNPIDVIGDAGADRYSAALDAIGDSPNIDGLAVILTPQVMTPVEEVAQVIIDWKKRYPLMPITTCFMGEDHVESARLKLQEAGIPSLETPERALFVLSALKPPGYTPTYNASQKNITRASTVTALIGKQTGLLDESTITKICELYDIKTITGNLATTADEAVQIAKQIGYPVIAKISSPDILHKTDIGGIQANLETENSVRLAWESITDGAATHHPKATIRGVLIQQFLPAGDEFIVGAVRDSAFGHLVMAGLGGIYTEILQDTSFRIAPITSDEAYRLLTNLHAWKLLQGARGKGQLDIDGLAELLKKVSELVHECPQIQDIDCNPVFVKTDGVTVADAKIVVG